MDDSKDCPRCGLSNPPTALECDCGFPFDHRSRDFTSVDGFLYRLKPKLVFLIKHPKLAILAIGVVIWALREIIVRVPPYLKKYFG